MSRELSGIEASLQPPSVGLQGAYGFSIHGLPAAGSLLGDAVHGWPDLRLDRTCQPATKAFHVDDEGMVVPLGPDEAMVLEWASGRATLNVAGGLPDHLMVHPYLAPVAAAFAWRRGCEVVHAGAFVAGGLVWGIVAEKEGGKSSVLAWLVSQGHAVFADDMVVLDAGRTYAGPRCIDLRHATVEHVADLPMIDLASRIDRQRVLLPPVASELPFGGWVLLTWGHELEVRRVPPAERIARLSPHRSIRLMPHEPAALVEAIAHPMWELARPRDWRAMPHAIDALLATVNS